MRNIFQFCLLISYLVIILQNIIQKSCLQWFQLNFPQIVTKQLIDKKNKCMINVFNCYAQKTKQKKNNEVPIISSWCLWMTLSENIKNLWFRISDEVRYLKTRNPRGNNPNPIKSNLTRNPTFKHLLKQNPKNPKTRG